MSLRDRAAAVVDRLFGALNDDVRSHMGACTPVDMQRVLPRWRNIDAATAALELFTSWGATIVAFNGDPMELFDTIPRHARPNGSASFGTFEVKPGVMREGLSCGLVLFHLDSEPGVAHCFSHDGVYTVRVLARSKATAERVLAQMEEHELTHGQAAARLREEMARSVNGRLRAHFDNNEPQCLRHVFPSYLVKNATIVLHRFLEERGADVIGFETSRYERAPSLPDLWKEPSIKGYGEVDAMTAAPTALKEILIGGELHRGLEQGVALLDDGGPVALCCFVETGHPGDTFHLWVLAADVAAAEAFLKKFLAYEEHHSLLRGRLVRPQLNYRDEVEHAEILHHEPVSWADVVLPADIEERVRTEILQFARRGALLKRTGLEMKRGVLLHGPPGTGKTLLCRLLATELQGFTTIVVAGNNLLGPSSVFALARRLAPSLVVLEDVDLIGSNRDENGARTVLGSLLNELDGMGRQDQVIVVLTTNRLNVLEEALVDRPGRVDTVIGLPIPSAELRRRLLHRFAGNVVVDDDAVDAVVERTDEASPAFLREVMKRAVLHCPEPAGDDAVVVDKTAALQALNGMIEAHRDRAARRIIGFVR